ncbi:hypothetical protein Nepgr_023659 [Nepenthes gracilis]|uniref:Receptor-like serine/threonine-protein kinase n=1 Tax=Nepenthes gracilis TaxID=150966 RepID=A0AAD3T4N0_NEPGR|nr:hypothetical protein Nepgr_023659 [Nepenthes gracilis]
MGRRKATRRSSFPSMEIVIILSFLDLFAPLAAEILPGSVLYASNPNQTWSSSNNTFFLRFIPATTPTARTTTNFSLAITYGSSIPIWKAGGDAAIVDASASFHFLSDGNLCLLNGSGSLLWQSNTSDLAVSSAILDEDGNFILKRRSMSVWSTFDHPTDTLVPSQNFTTDKVLTSGLYSFRLLNNGNLTLRWNDSIMYWSFGWNYSVSNTDLRNPVLALQSLGILSLADPMLSSVVNMAYCSDFGEGDNFRFLRLDSDGNLRIYSFVNGSGTVCWTGVSDQCEVFGYCGDMGICSYGETGPICRCPSENFDPIDPNDSRKGCKRKMELKNCPLNATMLQMDHTLFLTYPPETSTEVFIVGISACRSNCLEGYSCVASTVLADSIGQCYMKTSNFVGGYQSPAIPSTSFVKVCSPELPNPPPSLPNEEDKKRKGLELPSLIVVAFAVLSTMMVLVILAGGLWFCCCRNNPVFGGRSSQYSLLDYTSAVLVQFSYRELHRSTRGFRQKLGAGGFGAVYKGMLANGTVVAVKKLEGIAQGEKQFRMEVATISSTHHLNLVRLIGFCSERKHRLLVYEFMKNGSLDHFLFSSEDESEKLLNWDSRFRIALGTARGITYLHDECQDCIMHCDIKPENILLDENFHAKVSDFGLAKLINPKDHRYHTLTSVRGTRGYLAPEWLADLPITSKSDVYSYGMVLLEIVSGRRNFDVSGETNGKKFSLWAYEEFYNGNVKGIIDKRLCEYVVDMEQAMRAIQVSFWCIQEQPNQRPVIGKVVQMLEGIVEIEKPPPLNAAAGVSAGGASPMNIGSSMTVLSISAASCPARSASSSLQAAGIASFASGMDVGRPSSSILQRGSE